MAIWKGPFKTWFATKSKPVDDVRNGDNGSGSLALGGTSGTNHTRPTIAKSRSTPSFKVERDVVEPVPPLPLPRAAHLLRPSISLSSLRFTKPATTHTSTPTIHHPSTPRLIPFPLMRDSPSGDLDKDLPDLPTRTRRISSLPGPRCAGTGVQLGRKIAIITSEHDEFGVRRCVYATPSTPNLKDPTPATVGLGNMKSFEHPNTVHVKRKPVPRIETAVFPPISLSPSPSRQQLKNNTSSNKSRTRNLKEAASYGNLNSSGNGTSASLPKAKPRPKSPLTPDQYRAMRSFALTDESGRRALERRKQSAKSHIAIGSSHIVPSPPPHSHTQTQTQTQTEILDSYLDYDLSDLSQSASSRPESLALSDFGGDSERDEEDRHHGDGYRAGRRGTFGYQFPAGPQATVTTRTDLGVQVHQHGTDRDRDDAMHWFGLCEFRPVELQTRFTTRTRTGLSSSFASPQTLCDTSPHMPHSLPRTQIYSVIITYI